MGTVVIIFGAPGAFLSLLGSEPFSVSSSAFASPRGFVPRREVAALPSDAPPSFFGLSASSADFGVVGLFTGVNASLNLCTGEGALGTGGGGSSDCEAERSLLD